MKEKYIQDSNGHTVRVGFSDDKYQGPRVHVSTKAKYEDDAEYRGPFLDEDGIDELVLALLKGKKKIHDS